MLVKAPQSIRDTFEYFSMYNPDRSLMAWLSAFDFDDTTPRNIFQAVLDRFPDKLAGTEIGSDYDPKERFRTCLHSKEFQKNILWLVARAYPEIQRLIFVHIPKCAGTDLGLSLRSRYPAIKDSLASAELTTKRDLFLALRDLSIRLRFAERILLYGHIPLAEFLNRRIVRAQDQIFSILRNPTDMFVSKINYVITRITTDVEKGEIKPDSRSWLSQLGIDENKKSIDEKYLVEKYKNILKKTSLGKNMMCSMLGNGSFPSAIERIALYDIEIADTVSYDDWLQQRWSLTSGHSNTSTKFVSSADLDGDDHKFIASMTDQDIRLFEFFRNHLEKTGRGSVRGRDISTAQIESVS